jgi:hypothetical protein
MACTRSAKKSNPPETSSVVMLCFLQQAIHSSAPGLQRRFVQPGQ